MNSQELKSRIPEIVEGLLPRLNELADRIFENPEIAYEEVKASKWLSDYLEERGFQVTREAGGVPTAFKGEIKGASEGPAIAIISEYDALPGLGHACGHNIIATMGVGAAAAVAEIVGELPGSIISMGTPAEEGGGGKIKLIDAGVFDDVDAAMMIHPGDHNVTFRPSLGRVKLFADFIGKPSHAAVAPEKGINALDALVTAYQNIGLLRQQLPSDVRIHGIITHGGDAPNIIPERASALFYLRTRNKHFLPELVQRVRACAEGAAQAHGARVELREDPLSYEPFRKNPEMCAIFGENLRALGTELDDVDIGSLGAGSSDMGNLSWKVPAIEARLAMVPVDVAPHTAGFAEASGGEPGRKILRLGAQVMAMTAIDLLTSPERMQAVRRSFKNSP